MVAKVSNIKAIKLRRASKHVVPGLAKVYSEYGSDVTVTLLSYYLAKVCYGENGLTREEKDAMVNRAQKIFESSVNIFRRKL